VVREHLGLPQLFIDGTPHNGLTFTTYDQVREEYQEFADVGVDLFSFGEILGTGSLKGLGWVLGHCVLAKAAPYGLWCMHFYCLVYSA
jgi:hypothetical protein